MSTKSELEKFILQQLPVAREEAKAREALALGVKATIEDEILQLRKQMAKLQMQLETADVAVRKSRYNNFEIPSHDLETATGRDLASSIQLLLAREAQGSGLDTLIQEAKNRIFRNLEAAEMAQETPQEYKFRFFDGKFRLDLKGYLPTGNTHFTAQYLREVKKSLQNLDSYADISMIMSRGHIAGFTLPLLSPQTFTLLSVEAESQDMTAFAPLRDFLRKK